MTEFEIYKAGKLDKVLATVLAAANEEPKFGGKLKWKISQKQGGDIIAVLVSGNTKEEFELDTYVWDGDCYLHVAYQFSETEMFKGFLYYEDVPQKSKYSASEKKEEYVKMLFRTPEFSWKEVKELNAFLGTHLGFPVELMTDSKLKEIETENGFYRVEGVTFPKNFYSFVGYFKQSIGEFSRVFRKAYIYISTNDGFDVKNKLFFSVNLRWEHYSGGSNGCSFPLTNGDTGICFDQITREWKLIERGDY